MKKIIQVIKKIRNYKYIQYIFLAANIALLIFFLSIYFSDGIWEKIYNIPGQVTVLMVGLFVLSLFLGNHKKYKILILLQVAVIIAGWIFWLLAIGYLANHILYWFSSLFGMPIEIIT